MKNIPPERCTILESMICVKVNLKEDESTVNITVVAEIDIDFDTISEYLNLLTNSTSFIFCLLTIFGICVVSANSNQDDFLDSYIYF